MTRVPKAPTAPASVGVKMPRNSPPITMAKRIMVSTRPDKDAIFSLKLALGARGASSGFNVVQMMMVTMNRMVNSNPGRIPAMNSLPMDCSVMMP